MLRKKVEAYVQLVVILMAMCLFQWICLSFWVGSLQFRHNWCDGIWNHQPHHCLLNCCFRRRSKQTSKFRVTGLCVGNSSVAGEFPAQKSSNTENVSIWWRHHVVLTTPMKGMWNIDLATRLDKALSQSMHTEVFLGDKDPSKYDW